MAWTWWPNSEVGHNQEATKELADIIGAGRFETPKPLRLIQRVLQLATDSDSIVLDSFAGSGTTGHAVLAANAADGGTRRVILVEMDAEIAAGITRPRIHAAVEGYRPVTRDEQAVPVQGLGGGLRYMVVGEPAATEGGTLSPSTTKEDLVAFVLHIEGAIGSSNASDTSFLGTGGGRAVHLMCEGAAPRPFTAADLASLAPFDGPRVVYGSMCRVGEVQLRAAGVEFRQIPYQLGLFQ